MLGRIGVGELMVIACIAMATCIPIIGVGVFLLGMRKRELEKEARERREEGGGRA